MPTVSRLSLVTQIRNLTGYPSSSPAITDSEIHAYIATSISNLLDIVAKADSDHYLKVGSITSTGADTISLPSDCFQVKGVDVQLDSTHWRSLNVFSFRERNRLNEYSDGSIDGDYLYRVYADKLHLIPTPVTGKVFRVWYLPLPAQMTQDSDTIEIWNGWQEWIVLNCTILIKGCKQSAFDVNNLRAERNRVEKRILEGAASRQHESDHLVVIDDDNY